MNKAYENRIMSKLNGIMLWALVLSVCLLIFPFDSINPNLAAFINVVHSYVWLVFIVSLSFFISRGILELISMVTRKFYTKARNEQLCKTVPCLDFSEKALLREFILQRKSVLTLPVNEPCVNQLLTAGILTIPKDANITAGKAPMMIALEARPFITYKAVGLTRNKMSEDQISQLMDARPRFARPGY